ncbi:PP2C family protein-serine/threonine phosphatase [Nonomuraea glycinis]|uniref:PP2C family protein-serine/threonine phosphatase n=1 Tax=Nonomuraea glycinis TaxID=2047744 RepID=UPI002E0D37BC|nr:SpoIIE family protein phosphatase [Nonomuraea glycinis]
MKPRPEPEQPERPGQDGMADVSALLEDSAEELYENAPCGYLSTLMDGTVVKINRTLLNWVGYTRAEVIGRLRFPDLLTVGGKLYHETHVAPLLRMQGELNGIALEIRTVNGSRLPVLVTSVVKTAGDGRQLLVRTTVFDARDRRAYESELLRARHEAEEARRIAERDRERLKSVLGTLQRSLLPPSLPKVPGLEAVAAYHAASQDDLSGDFYDLFALGGERWCFFLGDVCGKGPEAAAVTSLTRATLRAAALHAPEPISMLGTLNTALQERYTGDSSRYCTVIVGILAAERDGFTVTLAGGGHPPALLLCADGRACYVPTTGGMPVGLLPSPSFVVAEARLERGDTLLLYTDGITEARTYSGDGRYGDEALLAFAGRLAPTSAAATIAAATRLIESFGAGVDDDTALLALGVPPA